MRPHERRVPALPAGGGLHTLLYTDVERARLELGKDITEIRRLPESSGKDLHYAATGVWDRLCGYAEGSEKRNRVRLVAGARNQRYLQLCSAAA